MGLRKEDLNDALCRTTVPTVRQGAFFPVACQELGKGVAKFFRVFAHKDVRAYTDGFLMLRIVVERDSGYTVEGGLLRDIARVGDDTLGVRRQPTEFQIA